ncbi:MAG: ribosome biogenesis GTP-binding protein YihA/YsxC [Candidatus Gracilibacteria bacterium]|nr:ribosome biogenesis GTP-binding protein YihA/YsxC [Candidatus Gracilibacteria bacterium]MDQ7022782.1 ribosome biogenesis GTP-binding protein YihA/YsxC [Candidatus Gracilibacteria bacterium]
MKLREVVFHKSVAINAEKIFLDNKKEIIFIGRSNVGKSSLMNALFNRKDLVKTSSRPGKTKHANIFIVNQKYNFTDLPGYGFAKLGKDIKEHLDALNSWYMDERLDYIKKAVIVIDAKIGPQKADIDMYEYLLELGVPMFIALAKIDRLNTSEMMKSKNHTENLLLGQEVFPVSSKKRNGIADLWRELGYALEA